MSFPTEEPLTWPTHEEVEECVGCGQVCHTDQLDPDLDKCVDCVEASCSMCKEINFASDLDGGVCGPCCAGEAAAEDLRYLD